MTLHDGFIYENFGLIDFIKFNLLVDIVTL